MRMFFCFFVFSEFLCGRLIVLLDYSLSFTSILTHERGILDKTLVYLELIVRTVFKRIAEYHERVPLQGSLFVYLTMDIFPHFAILSVNDTQVLELFLISHGGLLLFKVEPAQSNAYIYF